MRGLILSPARYEGNPFTAKFHELLSSFAALKGFDYRFADEADGGGIARAGYRVVIVLKPVQYKKKPVLTGLLKLPPQVKLIGLWDDIHQGMAGRKLLSLDYWNIRRFFLRCDMILCTYEDAFRRLHPGFAHKVRFLPHTFGEADFSGIGYNPAPARGCLLTGATSRYYPLRNAAAKNPAVTVVEHPGYTADATASGKFGESYARLLNGWFSSVTCASLLGYPVAKYFEIPAAGSLLIADHTPDMDRMGFVDGENYVRVTAENFGEKLREVLGDMGRFESVRRAGYDFARSSHALKNRLASLDAYVSELA